MNTSFLRQASFDEQVDVASKKSMRILVIDEHKEECEQLESLLQSSNDLDYHFSFIDSPVSPEDLSLQSFDVCIVDEYFAKSSAKEWIDKWHLNEKLPTVVMLDHGVSSDELMQLHALDGLNKQAVSKELLEHVVQNAYQQFHHEKNLEQMAFTDELTQLATKRMFEYQLDMSIKRITRTQQPITVAVFNIDQLQLINERYGAAMGDEVLKHFSDWLLECVRPYDCVARLGGDSFAIILEQASEAQALRVIDDIELINERGLKTPEASVGFSCTSSILVIDDHALPDSSSIVENSTAVLVKPDSAFDCLQEALMRLSDKKASLRKDKIKSMIDAGMRKLDLEQMDELSALSSKLLH